MKKAFWTFGVLLALGGGWIGRGVWRAHRQLVSLDVYNAPVADVLKEVQRQTWTAIRWDETLTAPITIHADNQPLAAVLERIAQQSGARLTTVYAVYADKKALHPLETALRQNTKTEAAGWTRLAPKPAGPEPLENGGPQFREPADGPGGPPMGAPMMVRHQANGVTIVQDGSGAVEEWSPTELMVETAAQARLGDEDSHEATRESAIGAAKKIRGDWTIFHVFRKSKFSRISMAGPGGPPAPGGRMDFSRAQREPLERFANTTPHERVERARQQPGPMLYQRRN